MGEAKFDEKKFIEFLVGNRCIGFFEEPIKLSSGQESSWYVNLRELQSNFFKLEKFTDFIKDFLVSKGLDKYPLIGVPESATLPAIMIDKKLGFEDFIFLRQQLKSHGVSGKFPYSVSPLDISGKTFTLLEDTATTGDSVITTALHLYEGGAKVNGIVVVCYREDRRWGGVFPDNYIIAHLVVPVYCMSKARNILPIAIEKLNPSKKIIESLMKEYKGHLDIYNFLYDYSLKL
jgi:orotate phosphoribosyltransferase